MNQFKRLDELVASAPATDWWGDHGVLLAADVLRSFKTDDWDQLTNCWADRPERWQCCAADVLTDGDERRSVPLLLDIIERGSELVRIAACDSLRVLLQGRIEPLEVSPAIKTVIDALRRRASGLVALSMDRLQGLVR